MSVIRYFANATDIAWADSLYGYPKPGQDVGGGIHQPIPSDWAARIAAGQSVPGVTKTIGSEANGNMLLSDAVCPWQSSKKGVANTVGRIPQSHTAAQTALTNLSGTITWFYNYQVTPWAYNPQDQSVLTDPGPNLAIPAGIEFVPMFYNGNNVTTQTIAWADPWVAACGHVMTFNEPYGETNMTVAQAIAVWPQIQALADKYGAKIVSPAIGGGSATATQWLSDFMSALASNGLRVDIIAFHETRGSLQGTASVSLQTQAFFQFLDGMRATYPTYPFWVTETQFFSTNDAAGIAQIADMVRQWQAGCDARPWVERCAWWPLGSDPVTTSYDSLSMSDVNGALLPTGVNFNNMTHK